MIKKVIALAIVAIVGATPVQAAKNEYNSSTGKSIDVIYDSTGKPIKVLSDPSMKSSTADWSLENGKWYFNDITGTHEKGWIKENSVWYYLDTTTGAMHTGWLNDNGAWYYLDTTTGAMHTGWFNDNGTLYYLDSTGKMEANTTINGYIFGSDGAMII